MICRDIGGRIMIARLLVIMKQLDSGDVGLGLLNSLTEIPGDQLDGIQGDLGGLDATATEEEAVLFKLLEHKLPYIAEDAGKILDGGRYVDSDGVVGENPRVVAHVIANSIRHPEKASLSWEEIEEMICKALSGSTFLEMEEKEEEKIIEFKGGKL